MSDRTHVIALAILIAGCGGRGPAADAPEAPAVASEPSLAAQAEAVRAGTSEAIVLEETLVTDGDLASLRDLAGLKELILRNTRLSDAAAESLAHLVNLKTLNLQSTELTN